jgi:ankyrin repeat protein/DNA-binding response OmpR family regulator
MNRRQILIAHSCREIFESAGSIFRDSGYEVLHASDGNEAWQIIQEKRSPPLIIIEGFMKTSDGMDICQLVRMSPFSSEKYIVALSERSGRDSIVAGLDAGADDYMVCPFDSAELLARIRVGERIITVQGSLVHRALELQRSLEEIKSLGNSVNKWQRVARMLTMSTHSLSRMSNVISRKYRTIAEAMERKDPNAVKSFLSGPAAERLGRDGYTLLHWASEHGFRDIAELMLSKGMDVNSADRDGLTPMHYGSREGRREIAELLLSAEARIDQPDINGFIPIHWASFGGHLDTVELLIARGSPVNARDGKGCTPLHWAAGEGHADAVELLLAAGAEICAVNDRGSTPLHRASRNGHSCTAEILIARGASVEARDIGGRTPLMMACMKDRPEIAASLLKSASAINAPDFMGRTALHWAAMHGNRAAAGMLVSKGVLLQSRDRMGRTPRQIAVELGHEELAGLLGSCGEGSQGAISGTEQGS